MARYLTPLLIIAPAKNILQFKDSQLQHLMPPGSMYCAPGYYWVHPN